MQRFFTEKLEGYVQKSFWIWLIYLFTPNKSSRVQNNLLITIEYTTLIHHMLACDTWVCVHTHSRRSAKTYIW